MSRRLLELCLLAYPRARREHDREYLRDLALELAESDGVGRQAASLVLGGLRDRLEVRRSRRGAGVGPWVKRAGATCLVLGAAAVLANGLIGSLGGGAPREVEAYACVEVDDSRAASADCMDTRSVAARERQGWECMTRGRTSAGRREVAWECSRSSSAF